MQCLLSCTQSDSQLTRNLTEKAEETNLVILSSDRVKEKSFFKLQLFLFRQTYSIAKSRKNGFFFVLLPNQRNNNEKKYLKSR